MPSPRPTGALVRPLRRVQTTPCRPSSLMATSAFQSQPCRQSSTSTSTSSNPPSGASTPSSSQQPSQPSSTVNPLEISHFNALASTWWDPHGPSRILHLMNPLRHDFIRDCCSSFPQPTNNQQGPTPGQQKLLRYLDVGCGGGIFAESAARLPTTSSVTALDPSPEVLAIARRHARTDPLLAPPRLVYHNMSVEDFAAASPNPNTTANDDDDNYFDIVTTFEVVEHVDNPSAFLSTLSSLVRPKTGWLILSTIARTWTSWLTTNVAAEDVLGIVPKGTHDWNKYINEDELRAWFAKQGGWGEPRVMGVVYMPGLGWREVRGSEKVGNYFFGVRREA